MILSNSLSKKVVFDSQRLVTSKLVTIITNRLINKKLCKLNNVSYLIAEIMWFNFYRSFLNHKNLQIAIKRVAKMKCSTTFVYIYEITNGYYRNKFN